jgi:hypothetical protein
MEISDEAIDAYELLLTGHKHTMHNVIISSCEMKFPEQSRFDYQGVMFAQQPYIDRSCEVTLTLKIEDPSQLKIIQKAYGQYVRINIAPYKETI